MQETTNPASHREAEQQVLKDVVILLRLHAEMTEDPLQAMAAKTLLARITTNQPLATDAGIAAAATQK